MRIVRGVKSARILYTIPRSVNPSIRF